MTVCWKYSSIYPSNRQCELKLIQFLRVMYRPAPITDFVYRNMTRVSKTWRAYIKSQPSLWYDISFKGSRSFASPEIMKTCILNSQKGVRRLQLHNVRNPYDALRQASMCPRLEHLDLDIGVDEISISQSSCLKLSLKTLIISSKMHIYRNLFCEMIKLPNLERLEVHRYVFRQLPNMSYVDHLPNLKALVLDMKRIDLPSYYKHVWFPEDVPDEAMIADLPTRKTYSERVPKLEELRLATTLDVDTRPFHRMIVCLNDVCHPNLRTLEICNMNIYGTWAFPETIEHLRLVDCHRHIFTPDCRVPPRLPNLKSLTISQYQWIDMEQVLRILQANDGALETLRLESCDNIRAIDVPLLASQTRAIRNLKTLHLHGMGLYVLGDGIMLYFLGNTPKLEELHVPNTGVTGSIIKRILLYADGRDNHRDFPRLKLLNLKGCGDVSSEALEWGRARGLKIMK
jgi:F-box/TPR repeat protein Pof3